MQPFYALTNELLAWIEARPRTYEETLDAWRTNCPRLAAWEEATSNLLVDTDGQTVFLTEEGEEALAQWRKRDATEARLIREIQDAVGNGSMVPASVVHGWMGSESLDVQALVHDFITAHSRQIDPPLSDAGYMQFIRDFYKRCLQENVESQYASVSYIAGMDLCNWFKALWNEDSVPREYLLDLKSMLSGLYRRGDSSLRQVIVQGTVEHRGV